MSIETEMKPPYTREQCQTLAAKIKAYFHGEGGINDADVFTAAEMLEHFLAGTITAHRPPETDHIEQHLDMVAAPQTPKTKKYCDLCQDNGGYYYSRNGEEPCCT